MLVDVDYSYDMVYTVSGVSKQTNLKEWYKVEARNQHEAWLKVSTIANDVVVESYEPMRKE